MNNKALKVNKIIENETLKPTDLENFFDVYIDARGNYSFNLNSTMYFSNSGAGMPEYICDTPMFWPLASYKIYGTTRFAWLLMKLNNVKATEMFRKLQPGEKIVYLPGETVQTIVEHIHGYGG